MNCRPKNRPALLNSFALTKDSPVLENPHVAQATAQPAAVIRLKIPRAEIREVMGPGYAELIAAVTAQGVGPAGPWYSHHFRMDPEVFDFEIGIPVTAPIRPVGRVVPGERPAGRVCRTVYCGPYEGLGDGWGEFEAWIMGAGHAMAPNLWEIYTTGPESASDPAGFRTELNRPIAD